MFLSSCDAEEVVGGLILKLWQVFPLQKMSISLSVPEISALERLYTSQ